MTPESIRKLFKEQFKHGLRLAQIEGTFMARNFDI